MKITLLSGKTFDFVQALGFEIKVTKSVLARRLSLRIDERFHLPVLTIPKFCSNKKALAFVQEHEDWIKNTLAKLPQSQTFCPEMSVQLNGQIYILKHSPALRGTKIEANTICVGGDTAFFHRRISDSIKKIAEQLLTEKSNLTAKKIGQTIQRITIKETKSRWGSCSTKHNINYNWRIIFAPSEVIDYLVCHEVSHLKHPDHSADFWACVEELCPHYKTSRHWLKVKGKELYQYL